MTAGTAGAAPPKVIAAGNPAGPREETSLLAFASIILANRRLVMTCALLGTIVAGVRAASEAELYESRSAFVVKGVRAPVQVPGGAAALGIALSAYTEQNQSISFYSDLARARNIVRAVAEKEYTTLESGGRKMRLPAAMGIHDENPAVALGETIDRVTDKISYNVSTRTGVVKISVGAADPVLAQQINANILAELEKWSTAQTYEQAVRERRFMEQVVSDARLKLTEAEQAERSFLEINRQYENSPELKLEYHRRRREVETRQEIYTMLMQTLEQARIEEVRRPAVLNVIEAADLPVKPQRKEAVRQTLIGLAIGLLTGMVLAILRQRVSEKEALG